MKAHEILKSKSCDEKIIEKYKEELSSLYSSKFDLIFDHKLKIDANKINEIVELLEHKSEEKLKNSSFFPLRLRKGNKRKERRTRVRAKVRE